MSTVGIIVIIMLLIAALVAGYFALAFAFKWPPFAEKSNSQSKTPPPAKVSDGTLYGVWGVHPGSGYVNGYTFEEAKNYCNEKDCRLATREEVTKAGQMGKLDFCAYAWVSDGGRGLYVQKGRSGCGPGGYFKGYSPSKKFGIWLVGTIPKDIKSTHFQELPRENV